MTTSWSGTRLSFPRSVRRIILQRDPVCRCRGCQRCSPSGCARRSTVADHVIPHAEGGADTPANGQGMCDPCHAEKTKAEQARGRARRSRLRPADQHPGLL